MKVVVSGVKVGTQSNTSMNISVRGGWQLRLNWRGEFSIKVVERAWYWLYETRLVKD